MAIRRHQGERLEIEPGRERPRNQAAFPLGTARRPAGHEGTPPAIGEYLIRQIAGLRHSRRLRHPGRFCAPVLRDVWKSVRSA